MNRDPIFVPLRSAAEFDPHLVPLAIVLSLIPLAVQAVEVAHPTLRELDHRPPPTVRSARALLAALARVERAIVRHQRAVIEPLTVASGHGQLEIF